MTAAPIAAAPTTDDPRAPTGGAVADRCPTCGAGVPADAPSGLCPRCLLSGVGGGGVWSAAAGAGGSAASSRVPFTPPGLAELAGHFPELELDRPLGRGGMGAVYAARQVKLDRVVALKVLPPEVDRDGSFAGRFLREARTLARLNHPHVVQVYDFGRTAPDDGSPGLFYFLMEYVDGPNLRNVIAAGSAGTAQALEIVRHR